MTSNKDIALWTIQHEGAWENAKATGLLKPDGRRVWREFRMPYKWIIEQMTERIPAYQGGYPLWAWYDSKPDLRQKQLCQGEKGVRIEFVANYSDILVSDFEAWHDVLNGYYLSLSEEEDKRFCEGGENFCVWRDAETDARRANLVMRSWERIFDINLLRANVEWCGLGKLQATLGQITLEQVTAVTPFTSK